MSAVSNARWVAITQAVKIGSQLVNMLVLTRLIVPSEYGLMAMAGIATNLAMLLRDMGTAAAIIQKETVSQQTATSIFWFNVVMGLLLCLLTAALAPLLAVVFKAPALTHVLWWLSLTFPIASSVAAHQAMLERASNFRAIATIESIASFLALVAALVAAVYGLGVYSLVIQALVAGIVSSVLIWRKSAWRPDFSVHLGELKGIFGFSGNMAGYQLTSYLFRNADAFIIGRYLGAAVLGIYSLAYKVMLFPVQNISWVASRALFPVMSRMQGNTVEMGALFLRVLSFLSFVTAPLMFGLMASADQFTAVAFASRWASMADILAFMALVGYLQVIVGATGPVLMALGRTDILFKLAIFGAVVHLLCFAVGVRFGGVGVAIGYVIASLVVAPVTFWLTAKLLTMPGAQIVKAIRASLAGALVMVAMIELIKHLAPASCTQAQLLTMFVLAGVLGYSLFSMLQQREQFGSLKVLVKLKRGG